jgi:predicted permease
MALVVIVLLVASSNIANMLLARSIARREEVATRLALGASPKTIVQQLLTESLLLSLAGGALGLVLTLTSNQLLNAVRLPIPVDIVLRLALDYRVLGFTLAVAVLATLAFGMAPAVEAARLNLAAVLRGNSGSSKWRSWGRGLVVAQVAASLLLLICSGLTLRSVANAHRIDPGFDRSRVVVATFAPRLQGYPKARAENFYDELLRRARDSSTVTSVAFASHLPLTIEMHTLTVAANDQTDELADNGWEVDAARVGPGYFETMGIPLLQGRGFTDEDDPQSACVLVVNHAFALRLSRSGETLGHPVQVQGIDRSCAIVGIVGTGKYRTLGEPPRPFVYRALAQDNDTPIGRAVTIRSGTRTLVARTSGDPAVAMTTIREMARGLDERIAISRLTTLEEATSTALVLPRFSAMAFGVFGGLGLVLAAIGVYSVMAYTVSRRSREIGIRMAMGARQQNILRKILLDGLALAAMGLALGWILAMIVAPFLGFMLYGVEAHDTATFASVAIFLAIIAGFAVYIPARRASVAEPADILRHE